MAMACSYVMKCSILVIFMQLVICMACGKLSSNFYESTCPTAISIIKSSISSAVSMEPRLGASFVHLHFHDCFVNGCDASVLLDDTPGFPKEKTAAPNKNSLRGFEVINSIKSQLEADCPGVVSCADILTVATRDSVVALGGPSWTVELGRRDSTTASFEAAEHDLPSPAWNLSSLISNFSAKGFTAKEMVALSGSHTIGQAKCSTFRGRLYGETDMDITLAASLKWNCPNENKGGDNNLSPMDSTTPNLFDNAYYKNLERKKGVSHSDQVLFSGGSTDSYVRAYSRNLTKFWEDFASAMVKMGNMSPLTGSQGQIRVNCRVVN